MAYRTAWGAIAFLVALAVPAATAACPTTNVPALLGDEDLVGSFYLEADSATSGAHVATDAAGSTLSFQAASAASGLSDGLGVAQNQEPSSTLFGANGKTATTHYLNLSKPIVGTVFVRSQATNTAQRDPMRLRAELFVNGVRAGGTERVFGTSNLVSWQPMHLCFRPETQTIPAGADVSVRIFRYNSLSDLEFGTHDPAQSSFRYAYFETDPLAGAFYLEEGRLVSAPSSIGNAAPEAAVFMALAGLAPPRHRARNLALLVAASVMMGGCAGPGQVRATDQPSALPMGTVESGTVEDPALKANGTGAIRGLVQSRVGLPVVGAHVALLGTPNFVSTDGKGMFRFDRLAPNTYTMRLDAEGFRPIEQAVRVELGKILFQNFTLVEPDLVDGAVREHVHDYWGDETRKLVSTTEFTFTNTADQSRAELQRHGVFYCSGLVLCQGKVRTQEGASILPGTGLIEVHLKWDASGAGSPKEAGLAVTTPVDKSAGQVFVFRKSGDPFRIAIFPNEADPGHQKFTNWVFFVQIGSQTNTVNPFGQTMFATNLKGTMEVFVNKAVVPYEPTHRDMWGNRTELPIFKEAKISSGCAIPFLGCGEYPYAAMSWSPAKEVFIPAGTLELKGTLSWTHPGGAPAGTKWLLAYRSADVPAGDDRWAQASMTDGGATAATFVITVKPEMADQFYQTASNWQFSPDDNEDQVKWGSTGLSGTSWTLTMTAYRDPAWVDA